MTAEDLIAEIDELLDDDRYAWAFETLCGIRETLTNARASEPTDNQARAVRNIKLAKSASDALPTADEPDTRLPSERRQRSRRYEGL